MLFPCSYFIKDGAVSEAGTHDELLALRGGYYEYVQLQALSKKIEVERERLRGLRRAAWHREMIVAGVVRAEPVRAPRPTIVRRGKCRNLTLRWG